MPRPSHTSARMINEATGVARITDKIGEIKCDATELLQVSDAKSAPKSPPKRSPVIIRSTDAPQYTQKEAVPIRENKVLNVIMGEGSKTSFPAIRDRIYQMPSQKAETPINLRAFFI